ncbi:hypothetical protein [Sphingopyxis sp.]|uniref:hypothetical protein n=1 Tax=Sphingopyxis sp. TaxID=1908224 RepID=UPI0035AEC338
MAPTTAPTATDVALGLQLCRAGIMSLTRLQLALDRGDRSRAMETVDDLHALDISIARTVAALPAMPSDERLAAAARRLQDEKMALAFEKLTLASGVSGPGLSSGSPRRLGREIVPDSEPADDGPVRAPRLAARWSGPALRVAALLAIAAGTVGVLVMAL